MECDDLPCLSCWDKPWKAALTSGLQGKHNWIVLQPWFEHVALCFLLPALLLWGFSVAGSGCELRAVLSITELHRLLWAIFKPIKY